MKIKYHFNDGALFLIKKLSYKILKFNKKCFFKVDLVKDIYYNRREWVSI